MSPIERRMLDAFTDAHRIDESERAPETSAHAAHRSKSLAALGLNPDRAALLFSVGWSLYQELPVGRYRTDFALVSESGFIAVECDGHDFHDRTPDQAAHDRRRDRFFALNGWITLRFTGREIVRDATACVAEVFEVAGELDARFVADWDAANNASKTGALVVAERRALIGRAD